MSKVIKLPNQQLIHDEAAEWLLKVEEGNLSKKEVLELTAWLEQSDLHKQIFKDTMQVWEKMGVMEGLAASFPLDEFQEEITRRPFFRLDNPVFATLFVCAIALSLFINQWMSREMIYQTKIGVVQSISMQDGSEVTLNTDSKIEAKFDTNHRDIKLQRGEAFFEVAHNEKVPFIVTVGNTRIQAVGTAFSVQKLNGVIEVTVTDGRVKISGLEDSKVVETLFVDKGQMMLIDKEDNNQLQDIDAEKIAQVLMWQKQMLAFNGESLREVIQEFGRYTEIKLLIADEETAQIRVGGYFRSNDLDGLLLSLKDNFNISTEQINSTTVLLSRNTY